MRQIGSLNKAAEAHRFAAYLVTEGIVAHAEQDGDDWAIWVRDENHVDQARTALVDFRRNPDAATYRDVERTADSIRRQEAKQREQATKNVIQMRGRWNRGAVRRRPLILTLIALSILVAMTSSMGVSVSGRVLRTLMFCDAVHSLDPNWNGQDPAQRLIDIRRGELWRMVTPIFVHFGVMHLAFNLIMLYYLGSLVEDRRGTWRIGLMILVIAVVSNAAQGLVPAEWQGTWRFGGMSGVLYGLFGYIWMKTLYEPELGMYISRGSAMFLLGWMLLGISGLAESFGLHMANWAHGIGFLSGVVLGYGPVAFRSLSSP